MLRKGETGGWKTAEAWPVPGVGHQELALRADGILGTDEGEPGECTYMSLGAGLNRAQASEVDPPAQPAWTTEPFSTDLDVLGYLELRLNATASAADTAWIVTLQDIAPDSSATDVTAGYLRASQRAVDEAASEPGQPSLPNRSAEAVRSTNRSATGSRSSAPDTVSPPDTSFAWSSPATIRTRGSRPSCYSATPASARAASTASHRVHGCWCPSQPANSRGDRDCVAAGLDGPHALPRCEP